MKITKNFIYRILTGLIFVSILLGGILYGVYSYAIVLCVVAWLALTEFYNLVSKTGAIKVNKYFNIVGGFLLFVTGFLLFSSKINSIIVFLPYFCYVLILFISELYLKKENPIQSLAYAVLGQVYIALPFFLLNYLAFNYDYATNQYHYSFLLALFVILWVNDSFAYLVGIAFGKHRLFERISPKKSWEGFIGGAIFAVLSSFVFAHYFKALSVAEWIGFAVVVVVFGTFGDLTESLIKRTLHVKDSGNMLPGHGGILDRFDSMIFAIPALVIYIGIINYLKETALL